MGRLIALLFIVPGLVSAQELTPKPVWANDIAVSMAPALCKPESYFLKCFVADVPSCTNVINVVTEECLKNLDAQIPDMLSAADISTWSNTVGQCIGQAYAIAMTNAGKKKTISGC